MWKGKIPPWSPHRIHTNRWKDKSLAAGPNPKLHVAMQTVACAPTKANLRTNRSKPTNRRAHVVVRAEGKETPAAAPEKPKWTEPTLDPNTPSPIFGGSTGGLLRKAQVRANYLTKGKKKKTGGATRDVAEKERKKKTKKRGSTIVSIRGEMDDGKRTKQNTVNVHDRRTSARASRNETGRMCCEQTETWPKTCLGGLDFLRLEAPCFYGRSLLRPCFRCRVEN